MFRTYTHYLALDAHQLQDRADRLAAGALPDAEARWLRQTARSRIRLASLLGCPVEHISAADDRLRTHPAEAPPLLLTITEPAPASPFPHRFLDTDPRTGWDPFLLLGPCPRCTAEVPLTEITHAADLGAHLSQDPNPRPGRSPPGLPRRPRPPPHLPLRTARLTHHHHRRAEPRPRPRPCATGAPAGAPTPTTRRFPP